MIIINSQDTTHIISVYSRYTPSITNNELIIRNDDTKQNETITVNSNVIDNGRLVFDFDLITSDNKSYTVTINDLNENIVIYRGKMFATDQQTQKYKINEE